MAEKFVDRQSTYPNRYKVTKADGSTEYITLERADEPVVNGTPLNAATLNGLINDLSVVDWFGEGRAIPKSADLNTYTTNGKYYCVNESTAETLANSPTNANFALYVFDRTTTGTVTHLLITLTGRIYLRSKSTSSWRDWIMVARASSATDLNTMLAAGATVLSPNQYGDALPAAGVPGRIFLKKVTE